MSADPFKTLRDRQLEFQAEPVVLVDPATGEAGAIRLSGSGQDLRGLYASRPEANSVPPGTTYWAVDKIGEPQELSVSDGSTWTNI